MQRFHPTPFEAQKPLALAFWLPYRKTKQATTLLCFPLLHCIEVLRIPNHEKTPRVLTLAPQAVRDSECGTKEMWRSWAAAGAIWQTKKQKKEGEASLMRSCEPGRHLASWDFLSWWRLFQLLSPLSCCHACFGSFSNVSMVHDVLGMPRCTVSCLFRAFSIIPPMTLLISLHCEPVQEVFDFLQHSCTSYWLALASCMQKG